MVGGDAQESSFANGTTFMYDGRQNIRLFHPNVGDNGVWDDTPPSMNNKRWYPTVATLADGRYFSQIS